MARRSVQLHQIGVATSTPGFVAVIRAGDSRTSLTHTVSLSQTVNDGTRFAIRSGAYRYYELWITRLGTGYSAARINEVKAS